MILHFYIRDPYKVFVLVASLIMLLTFHVIS